MKCNLCPNECGADRSVKAGYCGVTGLKIAKYGFHPYEEPCLCGDKGSGAVFFCGCQLKCVFCQNYEVSRAATGKEITVQRLSEIFQELEEGGAANINLVNPSHYVREIAQAFAIYKPEIPVVYNTHSYENPQALEIANEFTDVYLADLKFCAPDISFRYTKKSDYFKIAAENIKYMAREKRLEFAGGEMKSGVIVRHLILPLCASDSVKIINFVKDELPEDVYFSLMAQYTPFGETENYPELRRRITAREYARAADAVVAAGLKNVYLQERSSAAESYIPAWDF